ncbi:hypothetical protein ACFL5T_02740 [Gemmatimonadota bacterium]
MMRSIRPLLLALAVGSCATMGGMYNEPMDKGAVKDFPSGLDETTQAARDAMVGAQLMIEDVEQVNDSTWMILGKKGTGSWSWGEMVRVVTMATTPKTTRVYVISKKKMATNVTAKGDYSDDLFSQMEFALVPLGQDLGREEGQLEPAGDLVVRVTCTDGDQASRILTALESRGYAVEASEVDQGMEIVATWPEGVGEAESEADWITDALEIEGLQVTKLTTSSGIQVRARSRSGA